MPSIIVVDREGRERTIEASSGVSLMETLRANGFDELIALCGGSCSCATCHVYLKESGAGDTNAMSEDEDYLLSGSSYRNDASRLSCQVIFDQRLDGLRITIAPEE
jgi:2Fe-2S ferredoxin